MSEIINKADETKNANELILNNILRSLTMLENSLDRLMRNNFYNNAQYPDKYFDIKSLLIKMRGWTSDYKMFTGTENFACLLSMLLTELLLAAIITPPFMANLIIPHLLKWLLYRQFSDQIYL